MRKIKIALGAIWYPLAMATYFRRAFERREDVELVTIGPYTGQYIPWNGGMRLSPKYVTPPTVPLPMDYINRSGLSPEFVEVQLPWTPDLWVQVDAGWWLKKPKATVVAHVATDPHVLNYDQQRKECDQFFNMQLSYSKNGDKYLPYAADPTIHCPIPMDKHYDGCLIGLQYEQRTQLVNRLRNKGYNILYKIGDIMDEFAMLYNESRVALNWSSLNDLNARTFEGMAMCLPLLTNRVPDLPNFFLEGEHYLGFGSLEEAEKQFDRLINEPEMADEIANNAYRKVMAGHTWDHRAAQILETCKLI